MCVCVCVYVCVCVCVRACVCVVREGLLAGSRTIEVQLQEVSKATR